MRWQWDTCTKLGPLKMALALKGGETNSPLVQGGSQEASLSCGSSWGRRRGGGSLFSSKRLEAQVSPLGGKLKREIVIKMNPRFFLCLRRPAEAAVESTSVEHSPSQDARRQMKKPRPTRRKERTERLRPLPTPQDYLSVPDSKT